MINSEEQARELISLILKAKYAVVLTGAGISTESGIPDYRSPDTGLWTNTDMSVVSLDGFIKNPSKYYEYFLKLYPIRSAAKPNPAHYLLGNLERNELLKGVITQNVDGLHQDGGSKTVYELHGSLRQTICLDCGLLFPMERVILRVKEGQNPPYCESCSGFLKPNAVFFGEALPQIPWKESVGLCERTDLLIVMGSSLQVSPANILPDIAIQNGANLVICNLQSTPFDSYAVLLVREKIGVFSTLVIDLLDGEYGDRKD